MGTTLWNADRLIKMGCPTSARSTRPLWIVVGAMGCFLLAAGLETGRAQVVLDGKFGTSGALAGPNFNVTSGMGATRGNNLFHSFTQFNLKAGDVASFTGPANIQNILSRVTGGSPSSIRSLGRPPLPERIILPQQLVS